jgi:hypothetical protein
MGFRCCSLASSAIQEFLAALGRLRKTSGAQEGFKQQQEQEIRASAAPRPAVIASAIAEMESLG